MVLVCPPRDCRHREGPRWLAERVYNTRAAELQARVDRARVRIAHANAVERSTVRDAVREFAAAVAVLGPPDVADTRDVAIECETTLAKGST